MKRYELSFTTTKRFSQSIVAPIGARTDNSARLKARALIKIDEDQGQTVTSIRLERVITERIPVTLYSE